MMAPHKIVGFILLNIIYSTYGQTDSNFTQDLRINHSLEPLELGDQKLYTYYDKDDTVITSFQFGYEECKIPGIISTNLRHQLGNGKIVSFTSIYTHFTILDFKNCSSYSVKRIDDGTRYGYSSRKGVDAVIPYYDTFDVFALKKGLCQPCRYNDKGERLQINDTLEPEFKDRDDYFLEPMKNISGISDGYLFGFTDYNSTVLRVLDSKYKTIKNLLIDGQYSGISSTHGHVTICSRLNTCPGRIFKCSTPRCQIFDTDLNSIAIPEIQQPHRKPSSIYIEVSNLETGGAMIALNFHDNDSYLNDEQTVFIQQIHKNGTVEPAIHFGHFRADFVSINGFISDNGEYCVFAATSGNREGPNDYSVIKCVIPKDTSE